MEGGMKTVVVHTPKRCRKPKMDIFDDHIDKVNNVRSKKYLPEDTNIIVMGMGGQGLIDSYNEKYFGIPKPERIRVHDPAPLKKVVKPKKKVVKRKVTKKKVVKKKIVKKKVDKSELKKAFNKQKAFINGKTDENFW